MIWLKLWLIANELFLLALLRRASCPTVSHRKRVSSARTVVSIQKPIKSGSQPHVVSF